MAPLWVWRRPTFPQANAVSSARRGLTSLFGMGRGGPPCYSHHVCLSVSTWREGERGIFTRLVCFTRSTGPAVLLSGCVHVKCSGY